MSQMLKKQSYIFQYVSLFLSVIVLVACSGAKEESIKDCKNEPKGCLTFTNEQVKIEFNTDLLLVENFYSMKVTSKLDITRAYLKGVNMDMGILEIPLTKHSTDSYLAQILLGMCSEPVMKWKLHFEIGNAEPSSVELTSYWSTTYVQKRLSH